MGYQLVFLSVANGLMIGAAANEFLMDRGLSAMTAEQFRLALFGRFCLEHAGSTVSLRTRKEEALLAYLVLNPGNHTREALAALFWGDTPDQQARGSLRSALADLRAVLGQQFLVSDRTAVQLNPAAPLSVDAVEFRSHATAFLAHALADPADFDPGLYTGELLAGHSDDWLLPEREAFQQLRLRAMLHWVGRLRALGRYDEAITAAHQVLAVDRAEERAHQHLIALYAATGNRPAARRQLDICRRALSAELNVEPSAETFALVDALAVPVGDDGAASRLTNLPTPLTSFIGREQEMTSIHLLLLGDNSHSPARRLLTLTGAGGSGKTRLAIQVARRLLSNYRDGVWWVDLGPLRDPVLVPDTTLSALGISPAPGQPPVQALLGFLRERTLLLVLDNCEHLTEATAQMVRAIVQACPKVQVLATSREPLDVPGEQLWPIPTFSVPTAMDAVNTASLLSYESVQLFVERARMHRPAFSLGDHNAGQVGEICRRLDGIPLAIELAAARVRSLQVDDILDRLENRLRLLSSGSALIPPRQQTLRASIDWSYNQLSDAERLLFQRLAVFVGGWTLAAAEVVCADGQLVAEDMLDLVARLVDRSLVVADAGRYRFLETLREYALERLSESGEAGTLRERHAIYFAQFMDERNDVLLSSEQHRTIVEITAEIGNVRAAWDSALAFRRYDLIRRAARTVLWYYEINNGFYEGEAVHARAVRALREDSDANGSVLSTLLAFHGYHLGRLGRFDEARQELEQGCEGLRQAGVSVELAFSLTFLGTIIWQQGDYANARNILEENLGICRAMGDKNAIALCLFFLGLVVHSTGNYVEADDHFREALAYSRATGMPRMISMTSVFSGPTLVALGKHAEARERLEEGLPIARASQDRWLVGTALGNLGLVLNAQGDYANASTALLEAVALADEFGNRWDKAWAEVGLGDASLALGHPDQAALHYRSGLQLATEADAIPIALDALAGFAFLSAQNAEKERALELTGHILSHPASSRKARAGAEQVRRTLDPECKDPVGVQVDLSETVRRILANC